MQIFPKTVKYRENGHRKLLPHHHSPSQNDLKAAITQRPREHVAFKIKKRFRCYWAPHMMLSMRAERGACRYNAVVRGCGGGCGRSAASRSGRDDDDDDDVPAKQRARAHTYTYTGTTVASPPSVQSSTFTAAEADACSVWTNVQHMSKYEPMHEWTV